jgi:hypothetical protein
MRGNSWHALGCQSLKRRSITIRHDRAMQVLLSFARSAGVLASLSPWPKDLSSLVPEGEFFFSCETVLVDHPLMSKLLILKTDFRNGFNEISRQAVLDAVQTRCPELTSLFNLFYTCESACIFSVGDATNAVWSREGVRVSPHETSSHGFASDSASHRSPTWAMQTSLEWNAVSGFAVAAARLTFWGPCTAKRALKRNVLATGKIGNRMKSAAVLDAHTKKLDKYALLEDIVVRQLISGLRSRPRILQLPSRHTVSLARARWSCRTGLLTSSSDGWRMKAVAMMGRRRQN